MAAFGAADALIERVSADRTYIFRSAFLFFFDNIHILIISPKGPWAACQNWNLNSAK